MQVALFTGCMDEIGNSCSLAGRKFGARSPLITGHSFHGALAGENAYQFNDDGTAEPFCTSTTQCRIELHQCGVVFCPLVLFASRNSAGRRLLARQGLAYVAEGLCWN